MKQISLTVDIPTPLHVQAEDLAVALDFTRVRKGQEWANMSIVVRLLLQPGLADRAKFAEFVKTHDEKYKGPVERVTFQVTSDIEKELRVVAIDNNLMRPEEGESVPNITTTINKLVEYALKNPVILIGWFKVCVEEVLGSTNLFDE